ncbi:DUF1289 domain-containing protein [Rheinheimera maricola]|uniref:DUF1289 domain-containing protein n=1 Tax=Rheinheimera maricola TaxID=2793282 RepID=A0ABS7XBN6_9GAMM|nr:DUF1289 domain-containing protein [Rheinheimera maricola]MBZ9612480.1 DUF1289 domain-containing protein [Rheinheimera maricola]
MSDSPCVRNCCLDQQNCCLGCGRLLDEIIEWHSADALRREQILELAQARLAERGNAVNVRHRVVTPSE